MKKVIDKTIAVRRATLAQQKRYANKGLARFTFFLSLDVVRAIRRFGSPEDQDSALRALLEKHEDPAGMIEAVAQKVCQQRGGDDPRGYKWMLYIEDATAIVKILK